ncbi:hypothetical protein Pla175_34730 [Pirellulimonas nuda]|uniref:IrrE N-terminal-like domain-containing protein n=1 Tax=Pirellulimonas nuda TaxID=2528009 RepID=A0A518DF18_9BACT|nr:ImmA/IrrE family metallo-endopeptidase [Pirellulimonas nuda]QDU90073.1 hypothetical protein Pla175_34730 [Pirellulimonas nuda]
MLADIPFEEWQDAIERCASDLLWEAGIDEPPVDAFLAADRLGLIVADDGAPDGQHGWGDGVHRARLVRLADDSACGGVAVIALSPEARPERRHFAVAHEIGEAFAWRVFGQLALESYAVRPDARERVANELAGCLLAPRRWLAGDSELLDDDLADLKRRYATASWELLARRTLLVARAPVVVTVFDHGRVTWRRSSLPGLRPPLSEIESDSQQRTHRLSEPSQWSKGGGPLARVRCWPVHEPGWRREVMRTELWGDE